MNKYPLWKYVAIALLIVLATVYALPNLYAPDPAVQVTGQSSVLQVSQRLLDEATDALEQAGVEHFGGAIGADGTSALIRLRSVDDQLVAKQVIQDAVGLDYVVALNMASNTPAWLRDLGAGSMKLGLDLSGGVHFLLEVDTLQALKTRLESLGSQLGTRFQEAGIGYRLPEITDVAELVFDFRTEEDRVAATQLLRSDFPTMLVERFDDGDLPALKIAYTEAEIRSIEGYAVEQNLVSLRNRVNELGVAEPLVARQGANRIVVELPGIQDTAEAKRIIGKTANLEFRLVYHPTQSTSRELFDFEDSGFVSQVELERDIIVTGEAVTDASTGFDENGSPQVNITLNGDGGAAMNRATRFNVGRQMAVLFIEYKPKAIDDIDENGQPTTRVEQVPEKRVINVATIQSALGVAFRITGVGSQAEAQELALLLRAGALAAPMKFVEERTVGPSLGAENGAAGITSVQIGLLLVMLFMLAYYRVFGLFANVALMVNLVILVAIMSLIGATLTLPGIAGIVLTLGMAVDANVLIFSRIREELARGLPPQSAIKAGFEAAFSTILDANLTTLIVAIILYLIGTGPVQGFAVTLSIGIMTSMFTAIVLTRALVNLFYGYRPQLQKLWI